MSEPTQDCLFCKIATGELPAHILHEDAHVVAFLDLHPIREGHALVIPKQHFPWFEDLPEPLATRVTTVAQRIARAMKRLYAVERVSMFYTGIHVPHAHAHVVPMHHVHDVTSQAYLAEGPDSFSAPPRLTPDRMQDIASKLRDAL